MKATCNIVARSCINPNDRFDAGYFQKECIDFENSLRSKSYRVFSDICQESEKKFNPVSAKSDCFTYIEIFDIDLEDGMYFPEEIPIEDAPSRARKMCEHNDLLISTVRPNRNAVTIIQDNNNNLVCSTGFCVFKANKDIDPEVLFIFLKTKYAIKQLTRKMRATMYPAVANVDINNLIVPVVSKKLSNKIIKIIRDGRKARKSLKAKQLKIDAIVGKFCESLTEGINLSEYDLTHNIKRLSKVEIFNNHQNRIDAEFYRDLNVKIEECIIKYGKYKRLGEIYEDIYTGKTAPKSESRNPEESSKRIIKVATLTNCGVNWSKAEYISDEFFESNKKYLIKENDILFTSSAHSAQHIAKKVDVVGALPKDYSSKTLFVGELMLLRTSNPVVHPHYIASFLRSQIGFLQIQRCVRGITSHIYEDDIKTNILVPLPHDKLISEISELSVEKEKIKTNLKESIKQLVREYEQEIKL